MTSAAVSGEIKQSQPVLDFSFVRESFGIKAEFCIAVLSFYGGSVCIIV